MAKRTTRKPSSIEPKKERDNAPSKSPRKVKSLRATSSKAKPADNTPNLRVIYSNSKLLLLPLGLATDFKTKKPVVIFSDMTTAEVHTIALSVWNRWKMKEVKKISTTA